MEQLWTFLVRLVFAGHRSLRCYVVFGAATFDDPHSLYTAGTTDFEAIHQLGYPGTSLLGGGLHIGVVENKNVQEGGPLPGPEN